MGTDCFPLTGVLQDETGHGDPEVIHVAGEVVALSLYPRLMSILVSTDDLDPRLRSIGWVVRLMDELYDARWVG